MKKHLKKGGYKIRFLKYNSSKSSKNNLDKKNKNKKKDNFK